MRTVVTIILAVLVSVQCARQSATVGTDAGVCCVHGVALVEQSGFESKGNFSYSEDHADAAVRRKNRFLDKKAPNAITKGQSLTQHWIFTEPATVVFCPECEFAKANFLKSQ